MVRTHAYLVLSPILACALPVMGASSYAPTSGPYIQVKSELMASFPCSKAKTIDDRIICSNENLARLDRRMGEIYIITRGASSKPERDELLQKQREWLSGHDQACNISVDNGLPENTVECFTHRYHVRIGDLLGQLSQGNIIRELAGTEPWAENTEKYVTSENRVVLLQECVGKELAAQVNMCCAPGTETVEETESTTSAYAINGKRYLLYNGNYQQFFNVPRGACITEKDEKGEETTECPQVTPTLGSCAALFVETEPGKGDFKYAGHRWNKATTMAELLVGSVKEPDVKSIFAADLYSRLQKGEEIILVTRNGERRRYRWDSRKNAYVQQ